jgi:hypothetical protein
MGRLAGGNAVMMTVVLRVPRPSGATALGNSCSTAMPLELVVPVTGFVLTNVPSSV